MPIQDLATETYRLGKARWHNLFFALYPDPPTAERACRLAEDLRRRHGLIGQPTSPERLHVSLNSLGVHTAWPDQMIARASEAVVKLRVRPFVIAFNQVASYVNPRGLRALVLRGDEGLIGAFALHEAIHGVLRDAGILRRNARAIDPHLTLLRDPSQLPPTPIAPVRLTVREVVLTHSPYGEGRHVRLQAWPLIG